MYEAWAAAAAAGDDNEKTHVDPEVINDLANAAFHGLEHWVAVSRAGDISALDEHQKDELFVTMREWIGKYMVEFGYEVVT